VTPPEGVSGRPHLLDLIGPGEGGCIFTPVLDDGGEGGAGFGLTYWESVPRASDARPIPFTTEMIRALLNSAQSGDAARVAALCEAWQEGLPIKDDLGRFLMLTVQFFCAQTENSAFEHSALADQVVSAAVRTGLPWAEASARGCRALYLATIGSNAQAIGDLSRAAVLLSLHPAVPDEPDRLEGTSLRRMACNTLALALMRQGLYDPALYWLEQCRAHSPAGSVAGARWAFLTAFNEAWVHLAGGLDLDLAERSADAAVSYRLASEHFTVAAEHDLVAQHELAGAAEGDATTGHGGSFLGLSASRLAAAAAVLADDTDAVGVLLAVTAPGYQRPDHRAVSLLAQAVAETRSGDYDAALAHIDDGLAGLPEDLSFRSIVLRLLWAKAVAVRRGRAATAAEQALERVQQFVIGDRVREQAARRSAFEEAVVGERSRVELLADQERALVDELTGLGNRRAFESRMLPALEKMIASGRPAALVFIDIDRFKLVNDQRSHHVGDLALKLFASELRKLLGHDDLAVRYGGDEFLVVLSDLTTTQTLSSVEGLGRGFAAATAADADIRHTMTFSAGIVAVYGGLTAENLVRRADLTMLSCKRAGRDRVAVSEPHAS